MYAAHGPDLPAVPGPGLGRILLALAVAVAAILAGFYFSPPAP